MSSKSMSKLDSLSLFLIIGVFTCVAAIVAFGVSRLIMLQNVAELSLKAYDTADANYRVLLKKVDKRPCEIMDDGVARRGECAELGGRYTYLLTGENYRVFHSSASGNGKLLLSKIDGETKFQDDGILDEFAGQPVSKKLASLTK